MRLLGSFAVFADVNLFFIPVILAQNDFFLDPPSGCGGFNPGFPGFAALYDARPLAFSPPSGFLPSFLCHAGDLAIKHSNLCVTKRCIGAYFTPYALSWHKHIEVLTVGNSIQCKQYCASSAAIAYYYRPRSRSWFHHQPAYTGRC